MAEEAGKILELLSIDRVAESYRVIREMQPVELLRHLEDEKISTRGQMPELRARLLRFRVRKCHPHVQVPWYPEDEDEKEEKEVEVEVEDSLIKSLVDKVDFLQNELEKFKIRYEEEKRDDVESDESSEEDYNPSSDGEKNVVVVDLVVEPTKLAVVTDDDEVPDFLDEDDEVAEINDEKREVPNVAGSVGKADNSIQYDWIHKECEKVFENQSLYNIPTSPDQTVKKNTPISQPMWPRWKPKQMNTTYQPKYQYYPNPELMINPQHNYLSHYSNQYYMPPNTKPYWL